MGLMERIAVAVKTPVITYGADTDLTPTNHMNNSIGQVVPITKSNGIAY